MDKLDKAVKSHYQKQELSSESLDRILKMGDDAAQDHDRASKRDRFKHFKSGVITLAASILLGVIITQSYLLNRGDAQMVLSEIAMNHNKRLDVEYPYQSFAALQSAMDRLDFKLAPPTTLEKYFALVGGRYCSIQGKLAAQLKVKDKITGKLATLYVTPVTEKLAKIDAQEVIHDNVTIRLWKDEYAFYGLATDS